MKLTLNIPDSAANKAIPLIEYLHSLDFITIEQDEEANIPEWHKQLVRDRMLNANTNLVDWDKIKDTFKLD